MGTSLTLFVFSLFLLLLCSVEIFLSDMSGKSPLYRKYVKIIICYLVVIVGLTHAISSK